MTHLMLVVLLQTSLPAGSADSRPPLRYQDAYQQMARTGRPMLVLVGADWCAACQRMKSSVIPQLSRRGSLRQVAYVTINKDSQAKLAAKLMSGTTMPQLILFTKAPDGWTRRQLTGLHSAKKVQVFLDRAIETTAAKPRKTVRQ